MSDALNSCSKPPAASQNTSEFTACATKGGAIIVPPNQIAMNAVEKGINLQADVLRAPFNDKQSLAATRGNPSAEVAIKAFRLIVDRSITPIRTILAAPQEIHKACLDVMGLPFLSAWIGPEKVQKPRVSLWLAVHARLSVPALGCAACQKRIRIW